jgi:hypothetical protein
MPSRNPVLAYISGAPDARANSLLWWIELKSRFAPGLDDEPVDAEGEGNGGKLVAFVHVSPSDAGRSSPSVSSPSACGL